MERKPLVLDDNGNVRQIQDGDTLNARAKEVDVFSAINEELTTIPKFSPVYISSSGKVKLSRANSTTTHKVIGLAPSSIASLVSGYIQTDGQITGSTSEWDAVTGQTGGLTTGATYFLDEANTGKIKTTAPLTGSIVVIGIALSETSLDLNIERPILL
ncbi:MAG: hypothetical protein IPL26_00185 [Leptospiraceae bacterium]|nr:hypothetical protein [Leptospiraceae bacterium]